MEEPITPQAGDEGANNAQPQQPAAGAETPQEPVVESQPAQADAEYAAWLATKSIDPNDPEAFGKVAQMAYNSEKLMTKATQEASELKKSMQTAPVDNGSGVDPTMQEFITDYKRDKMINSFKESHTDWKQHEPKMAELLTQPVSTPYGEFSRSQLVHAGFLSLEEVYLMAKGQSPVDIQSVKNDTTQEVLHTLANTQRVGGANTNATNSNPQPAVVDPIMEGLKLGFGRK